MVCTQKAFGGSPGGRDTIAATTAWNCLSASGQEPGSCDRQSGPRRQAGACGDFSVWMFKGSIRKDRLIGYWEDLNIMQFCFYLSLSPQSLRPSLTYSRHQLRCVLGLVEREIEAKPGHASFQFVTTGGSCLLLHNHLLEADSFVLSQPHPGKAHIQTEKMRLID